MAMPSPIDQLWSMTPQAPQADTSSGLAFTLQSHAAGSVGHFYLSQLPDSGAYVYLDVVYAARSAARGQIDFRCADFSRSGRVLPGGRRSHSLAVPMAALHKSRTVSFQSTTPITIESAVVRADYYDFFGLQSQAVDRTRYDAEEARSQELAEPIGRSVQWFVTWKCNFTCAYCWQEVAAEAYRGGRANRIEPRVWADRFERLEPRELYLTGGEPSLYKQLPQLIAMLDPGIELVMHSNLGKAFHLAPFIEHVATDRFRELTFSLHPTQCKLDEFFGKLTELQQAGYLNLMAEMVLYPQNLPFAAEVLDRCKAMNMPLRYDPYVPAADDPVGRDEPLLARMRDWVDRASSHTERLGGLRLWSFEKPQYWQHGAAPAAGRAAIFCPAGSKRINVDDEGDVYVCMSAIDRSKIFDRLALPHYAPIGNLFDDRFELLERPVVCWESFRCSACDFQVVDRAWTRVPAAPRGLPLPE